MDAMALDSSVEEFRSSWLGLFLEFAVVYAIVGAAACFLLSVWFEPASSWPYVLATFLAGIVCLAYMGRRRYARVLVDGQTVRILKPGRSETTLELDRHAFNSRIHRYTYNLIPVRTNRYLVAIGPEGKREHLLPGFSKKSFDRLLALLRRTVAQSGAAEPIAAIEFTLPKEQALKDFRRLVRMMVLGVLAVVSTIFGVMYLYAPGSLSLRNVGLVIAVTGLMIAAPALAVGLEFRRKRTNMPERIVVGDDALLVGEDSYPYSFISRLVLTPPAYEMGDFSNERRLVVEAGGTRKRYYMGLRQSQGMLKTVFAEYGIFCETLEKAAIAKGIEFVYDL